MVRILFHVIDDSLFGEYHLEKKKLTTIRGFLTRLIFSFDKRITIRCHIYRKRGMDVCFMSFIYWKYKIFTSRIISLFLSKRNYLLGGIPIFLEIYVHVHKIVSFSFIGRRSNNLKLIFQGIWFVAAWFIWNWRSLVVHEVVESRLKIINDDPFPNIRFTSLLWISNRCSKLFFSWVNWLSRPIEFDAGCQLFFLFVLGILVIFLYIIILNKSERFLIHWYTIRTKCPQRFWSQHFEINNDFES